MKPLILCVCLCLLSLGCQSEPVYNDNKNPDLYALDVKQLILNRATDAKKSREPEDDFRSILVELEDYPNRAVGEHGETYALLLKKCQEIHDSCAQASGRPGNLNAQIDELIQLTDRLPGTVTLSDQAD